MLVHFALFPSLLSSLNSCYWKVKLLTLKWHTWKLQMVPAYPLCVCVLIGAPEIIITFS